MKIHPAFVGVAILSMSSGAYADTIARTFDITASDFTFIFGPATPLPVDPVHLNFTIVFDPSVLIDQSTAGLTINSFTLANPPYSSAYGNDPAGNLTIATFPGSDFCFNPANSYCVFIGSPTAPFPSVSEFIESTDSAGYWVSQTTTITAGPIVDVPEPSTWAMMLIGFAGLGYVGYRADRRRAALSV